MSAYQLVSSSDNNPVTLDEMKLHLRVDTDEENFLILSLMATAMKHAENYTWLTLTSSVYNVFYDSREVEEFIYVNKCPVSAITSVNYRNSEGEYVAMSTDDYEVDTVSQPVRIKITNKPALGNYLNAWKVVFSCGYGQMEAVPDPIKSAIKLIVGHLYEHREDVTMSSNYTLENGAKFLLEPYKLGTYFI